METLNLTVTGMSCMGCVSSVKNVLEPLDGVAKVDITLEGGKVVIEFDSAKVQPDQLKAAINDAGYEVAA
ncbi:MAG: heavy-metal-associated domain-containing protein [Sulfuricella sp.]|nr:heavy-metal-associated domain-containing protein [Sulfuricella sp.]